MLDNHRFLHRFAAENKLSDDRLVADDEHDGLSEGATDSFNPTILDKFSQPRKPLRVLER
jgi:hypothetical protein